MIELRSSEREREKDPCMCECERETVSEREREIEMRARVVNHPSPDPNRASESPTTNSRFMPLLNRPPNLFKKKNLPDFARFWWGIVGIIVEVCQNHCLRGYFGEKKSKVVTCDAHDHCSVGQ